MTILTLTTGTIFIMWLGEQITERGIGNGISLIIFAGIVVGPAARRSSGSSSQIRAADDRRCFAVLAMLVFMIAVVALIVFVERGQRRIPVQYAKRVVGPAGLRRAEHVPAAARQHRRRHPDHLRDLDHQSLPSYIAQISDADWMKRAGDVAAPWATRSTSCSTRSRIVFFSYFYTSIVFNPNDTADNIRKYGGFIPGIRPGKKTADYIDTVLSRITVVGAVYLTFVALLPDFLNSGFKVQGIPGIGPWLDARAAAAS